MRTIDRCRSTPRPERGVGDADAQMAGRSGQDPIKSTCCDSGIGVQHPDFASPITAGAPQLRPWGLLAPRLKPRLPAHNLHQPTLTITLPQSDPLTLLPPASSPEPPFNCHQFRGLCDGYQWHIACDETSLKVGKSFLFAPLNQNPLHVSERATLIAQVGLRRVLRLAECLACESRVHMPGQDAQPAMSAYHLQLRREGIRAATGFTLSDKPLPSNATPI